jgi:hypothetical protein
VANASGDENMRLPATKFMFQASVPTQMDKQIQLPIAPSNRARIKQIK